MCNFDVHHIILNNKFIRLINEDFLNDKFEWNDELLDSVFEG